MVVYAGNWDRPCLDCGKTPADGAKFRGYPKPGDDRHYRKGSCVDCLRARVKKHTEQNPEQAKARWARAQANRDWAADHTRRKDRDPEYSRRRNIKNSFGITLEKYREHFEQQGPHCGICERAIHVDGPYNEDKAVLDHDHKTGELRSFLCPRCNVMIGMATDCPDILEKGATYLAARKLPW